MQNWKIDMKYVELEKDMKYVELENGHEVCRTGKRT